MAKPIIGMIHLAPLPGSPDYAGSMLEIHRSAARDAEILLDEGVDGLMIENFGDAPFYKDGVPPITIAAMTSQIQRLQMHIAGHAQRRGLTGARARVPIGVNVLRNDAIAALSIGSVVGAGMIRVNVHVGASVTDQGIIEGRAAETVRLRESLAPSIAILADVRVKHARPLAEFSLEEEIADVVERGKADAVLLTGARTGSPPSVDEIRVARGATSGRSIFLASGIRTDNVAELLNMADGVIVGSALKKGGRASAAVDRKKVREFMTAAGRL